MINTLQDRTSHKKLYIILAVVVAVLILGAGGTIVYLKFIKNSSGKQPEAVTNAAKKPTPPPAVNHTLKLYSDTEMGITLNVPNYWKTVKAAGNLQTLSATDEESGIAMKLELSKNGGNHAPCGYAIQDSELVKYTAPAEGQRTETHLSFLGNKEEPEKLCAVMITGPKKFTKGDQFNTINPDPLLVAQLPTDQIIATFMLKDDDTKHPDYTKAQTSTLYVEVIDALKSLQIK